MKRLFCLLLLALLLVGCSESVPETTAPPPPETTTPATTPSIPAGCYQPGSDLELLTGGIVRVYQPEAEGCYALTALEEDILVFSGEEATTLTLLAGDTLYPAASAVLPCRISPEDPSFRVSHGSITYYDCENRALVFLNRTLQEVNRIPLPDSMTGSPALSADRLRLYYCTADSIREYVLETGLDRLLKAIAYPTQQVEDVVLDDSLLRCYLKDADGEETTVFLSTETGQQLTQAPSGTVLHCGTNRYYARISDGLLPVHLFGEAQGEPRVLQPVHPFAPSHYLETSHSLLTAAAGEAGTQLELYDLTTELRTASLTLPRQFAVDTAAQNPESGCLYLLAREAQNNQPLILRWNPQDTPAEDDTAWGTPRYTARNPDEAGLERCAQTAEALENTYGVEILLHSAAVQQMPWDYTLEAEYQVPVIQQQLAKLAECLAHFPKDFFTQLPEKPRICLVRSIVGKPESGSVAAAAGLQFWAGDTPCVALIPGDTMTGSFFHEMFHVIDSRILSDSNVYYYWHNLNPEGCGYFEDYTSYRTADVEEYLQEENRAFIDAYSLCFPREDRARIMEYACQEGNAHYFQSEIMQRKLKLLCQGIRKVFGYEKYQASFLWEQYLNEPLMTK